VFQNGLIAFMKSDHSLGFLDGIKACETGLPSKPEELPLPANTLVVKLLANN
jgi:hypothetical protein